MFWLPDYFGEGYRDFLRLSRLCLGGDVVDYGRRQLSRPHRSNQRKKGTGAKARRRAKAKRRRK